jgi:hypothetical protein
MRLNYMHLNFEPEKITLVRAQLELETAKAS